MKRKWVDFRWSGIGGPLEGQSPLAYTAEVWFFEVVMILTFFSQMLEVHK
jgi:hypothetical protein